MEQRLQPRSSKFLAQFEANQTAEWKEKYCDYELLEKYILGLKKSRTEKLQLLSIQEDFTEQRFIDKVQHEIDKVSEFYLFKLGEYKERYQKLCSIAHYINSGSSLGNASGSTKMGSLLSFSDKNYDQTKQKAILKKAIIQLYRGTMMLQNFALLNNTAFVTLFDHYEKITKENLIDLHAVLEERDFATAAEVKKTRKALEKLYSNTFHSKMNTHRAREELSARRHDRRDVNMYLIGFFFGFSVPLILLWTLSGVLTYYAVDDISDILLAVLPVFRLVWIPTLGLWMYGLDTIVWHKARINYKFIFDYNPKTALEYRSVILWASLFLSIFSLFLFLGYNYVVNLFTIPWIPQEVGLSLWPSLMIVLISFICFYPFNFFWRSSRLCWLLTSLQVFIAPFGRIGFREFFVGDVYTSLVKTMFDLQYTICYFVTGNFLTENDETCSGVNDFLLPFISVAPLYWRLAQCLKRYYKTKEKVHIANALKYACASLVVLFSTLNGNFQQYEPGYWPVTRILWLISFILSTLYTFSWDLFMDWGLGRVKSKHFFLRDKLVWENNKWFYYYCIISNFIFRFFWAVTITPFTVIIDLQPEMLNLIAASIEIIRRFTWAILRVENEHLHNCGKFRAIQYIPLPFDVNKTEELEVQYDGSVVPKDHLEDDCNEDTFSLDDEDGIPIMSTRDDFDTVFGSVPESPPFHTTNRFSNEL